MIEPVRPNRTGNSDRETFWRAECEAFNKRGGNLQSFCRERKIGYQSFCYWRKRLGENRKSKKSGDEVQIPVLMPRGISGPQEIQIDAGGFVIKFPLTVDANFLARVLLSMRTGGEC